jgi:hypothetical protein
MNTRARGWLVQIAAVLVLATAGMASASSVPLSENSCRGKNVEDGVVRRGWASVSGEVHRGCADPRPQDAAGLFVAPAAQAASQARGGTYVLRDPATGRVMRSGRTGDLAVRRSQHARDPELGHLKFEEVYRTDVYAEQRGLEQVLHDTHNPPLNRIRPIRPDNPRRQEYLDAAQEYLRRQQGGN